MRHFQSEPTAKNQAAKIYEVREFVRFQPNGDLVPVHHYRTIYHRDGRISREAVASVESLLERAILAFRGHPCRQSPGILMGFFDESGAAQECAQAITVHHGRNVEVCGTQITIPL